MPARAGRERGVAVRRSAVVALIVVIVVVGDRAAALAQQPSPPPDPTDQQLESSRGAVQSKAEQIGGLSGQLAALQARVEALQEQLAGQREDANRAQVDLERAQQGAAEARTRADRAGIATTAASAAIDVARTRLDDFAVAAYQGALDSGPLGLLSAASSPDDLVARAQLTDAVATEQSRALAALERARVGQANAESTARLARDEAETRQATATDAQRSAAQAVAVAERAATDEMKQQQALDAERIGLEGKLADLRAGDATLRTQRDRFDAWERQQADLRAARDRAEQQAAATRAAVSEAPSAPQVRTPRPSATGASDAARRVIDRAVSQLGVTYAWGGGNASGATRGIRDGGVADSFGDYRKTGFDCSGLLIYAFAAAGVSLPHYSGYQYDQGRKVPLGQMQPGDLIAYQTAGRIGHIALYIGGGRMVEAPFSGSQVRIAPVRYTPGLLPYVARLL